MGSTREIFEQQCKRRFGAANPERMRLAHWEWMVRHGGDPYYVRTDLGLESHFWTFQPDGRFVPAVPDWCFKRFGMSRMPMADGRIICIGGEHEDYYDPDFCIYNDVIVLRPAAGKGAVDLESGEVEIYGYPEAVFPPTDFHSATLADGRIYIIGRLGYVGTRMDSVTPMLTVNAETYEVEQVSATGEAPGWIYKHHASFDQRSHAITVRGGLINRVESETEIVYSGAHRLHLDGMRWEVVSLQETHRRFLIWRGEVFGEVGREPTAECFRPVNVPHRWLPPEVRGVEAYTLDVCGVRVTFTDFYSEIRTLIEGDLPAEVVDQLLKDVVVNLLRHTETDWTATEVEFFD